MDFWAQTGRPALVAAVTAACNSIEQELAAEIQKADDKRRNLFHSEFEQLQDVAAKVERLEQENRSLRRQLEDAHRRIAQREAKPDDLETPDTKKAGSPPLPPLSAARPPLANLSPNKAVGTSGVSRDNSLAELESKYTKLVKGYAFATQKLEKTITVARQLREAKDGWIKYAEKLEAKIKRLEKRLILDGNQTPRSSSVDDDHKVSRFEDTPLGQTALNLSFMSNHESRTGQEPYADVNTSDQQRRAVSTPAVSTQERAWEEQQRLDLMDQETSDEADDMEDTKDVNEAAALPTLPRPTEQTPIRIKQEPSSDTPVVISVNPVRKRRRTDNSHEMPPPARKIKREQSQSSEAPILGETSMFSPHESIDLDSEHGMMPTPRKQRRLHDALEDGALDAQAISSTAFELQPPNEKVVSADRASWATETGAASASASTTRNPQRTPGIQKRRVKADWELDQGVADVAEESYETFVSPASRQVKGRSRKVSVPTPGRLGALLQGDATSTRPGTLGRDKALSGSGRRQGAGDSFRNQITDTGTRQLRNRPMDELQPEDFKVNPKFNSGHNYAFTEVVRNKADRAQLTGCTDWNCCGRKFRAMAESELNTAGPSVLTRAQDIEMLKDYLGDDSSRLRRMTEQEQCELWLKAKAQDLANRFGRHRDRFARRPSPPGFWNPDFPTTQEIAERREEGARLERELVEERWREAMRGGGRWLFRDE